MSVALQRCRDYSRGAVATYSPTAAVPCYCGIGFDALDFSRKRHYYSCLDRSYRRDHSAGELAAQLNLPLVGSRVGAPEGGYGPGWVRWVGSFVA